MHWMELDVMTLRLTFGVMAFTMLLLFYFDAHRKTRSAYSRWWCAALASFLVASAAFLLEESPQQVWATPVGCAVMVLGAACAWGAGRSLRGGSIRWWQVLAAPLVTAVASALDDPADDVWAGGSVYLLMTCLMFGMGGWEMWRADSGNTGARVPVVLASWVATAYFFARWLVFAVDGPDGVAFSRYVGTQTSTIVSLVFLVVVSFSMSALSNEMSTEDLRVRATRDGLTGLLNRTEFLRLAGLELRRNGRTGAKAVLILADLDHFKRLNDTHGHQAGDRALEVFAQACRETVRSTDLVGRYGGEEFILMLPGIDMERAEQITHDISARCVDTELSAGLPMPTVSYGIAAVAPDAPLTATVAAADAALYRAKTLGRDRAARA